MRCGVGYGSVGHADVPPICPGCNRPTRWRNTPYAVDGPTVPWRLTTADRRFLHEARISCDEQPDAHLGAAGRD